MRPALTRPVEAPPPLPLTTAQRSIWIGHQMEPDNPVFNLADCLEISGPLAVPEVATAINRTLLEADCLHSVFVQADSEQVVQHYREDRRALEVLDFRERSKAEAERFMLEDLARPIDLAHEHLFRMCLLRVAEARYWLYFRYHHIALDAYAVSLLFQRIAATYAERVAPDRAGHWRSFEPFASAGEEELLYEGSPEREKDRAFWLDYMRGVSSAPSFSPRSLPPTQSVLRVDDTLSAEALARTDALAARCRTHPGLVQLAAMAAYLGHHSGTDEVTLGISLMGRNTRRSAQVPATYSNVLPLRVRVDGKLRVRELVCQVSEHLGLLRRHRKYRGELLRRELRLIGRERRMYGPVFNLDFFSTELTLPGCSTHLRHIAMGPVVDYALSLLPKGPDGSAPVIHLANSRTYARPAFDACVAGLSHACATFATDGEQTLAQLSRLV